MSKSAPTEDWKKRALEAEAHAKEVHRIGLAAQDKAARLELGNAKLKECELELEVLRGQLKTSQAITKNVNKTLSDIITLLGFFPSPGVRVAIKELEKTKKLLGGRQ